VVGVEAEFGVCVPSSENEDKVEDNLLVLFVQKTLDYWDDTL
jgi:hypothetical protein